MDELAQEDTSNHLNELIEDFSAKNSARNGYILDRLQHNAAKMVAQAKRKGATSYQPQVGDEVLVLRDLNRTKKSVSKKDRLNEPYLEKPAKIVAISHNNRYKLRYLDDTPLPHNRDYFLQSHFKIHKKSNENTSTRQQVTSVESIPSEFVDDSAPGVVSNEDSTMRSIEEVFIHNQEESTAIAIPTENEQLSMEETPDANTNKRCSLFKQFREISRGETLTKRARAQRNPLDL